MKNATKLDKEIERAYYTIAQGKQINILDIPKVFRDSREFISQGLEVSEAVRLTVEKYCHPA